MCEKYSPDHCCTSREKRELRLFITGEGQVIEVITEIDKEEEIEEAAEKVELTLRSVFGFSTPGTMKLKGKIGDREVIVLIDCGATHNFIHQQLVDKLKIPVTNMFVMGLLSVTEQRYREKGFVRRLSSNY